MIEEANCEKLTALPTDQKNRFRAGSPPQNDDPHMAHDWIFNPEAINCCPNNDPLIDFAGHKWWTNYHWSKQDGPYVWGGNNPNEPLFGTVVDLYLATIVYKRQIPLAIEPPNNTYKSWPDLRGVLDGEGGWGHVFCDPFPFY